jgi:hypothetical protein
MSRRIASSEIPLSRRARCRRPDATNEANSWRLDFFLSIHFLRFQDCAPDDFGDLRDDGVSEGSNSVCRIGYPMKDSSHSGFNPPVAIFAKPTCFSLVLFPVPPPRPVGPPVVVTPHVGQYRIWPAFPVGDDPDSISLMWCANCGSGYTVPFRVIPERSKFPEHLFQSARSKGRAVFEDDPRGLDFGDDASAFAPQPRPGSFKPFAAALCGEADVLAWEAGANNVNWPDACPPKSSNVSVDRDSRPVLCEDGPAVGFDLTEGDGLHPGSFKSEAESADAGKEVEDTEGHSCWFVPKVGTTGQTVLRGVRCPFGAVCPAGYRRPSFFMRTIFLAAARSRRAHRPYRSIWALARSPGSAGRTAWPPRQSSRCP